LVALFPWTWTLFRERNLKNAFIRSAIKNSNLSVARSVLSKVIDLRFILCDAGFEFRHEVLQLVDIGRGSTFGVGMLQVSIFGGLLLQ